MSAVSQGGLCLLLLAASNCFMTVAWYLHLKFKSWTLPKAIVLSWLIASVEYCLQVPANRLGHASGGGPFSAPQLKVIAECLSLLAFTAFSKLVLKEPPRPRDLFAFALIFSGVAVAMAGPAAPGGEPLAPVSAQEQQAPGRKLLAALWWPQPEQGPKYVQLVASGEGSAMEEGADGNAAGADQSTEAAHLQPGRHRAARRSEEDGAAQADHSPASPAPVAGVGTA